MLTEVYSGIATLFDKGSLLSKYGLEAFKKSYEWSVIGKNKHVRDFSSNKNSRDRYSDIRYRLALEYAFVEFFDYNKNESVNNNNSDKYFLQFKNANALALNLISKPLPEDRTKAKLLRGYLEFNVNQNYDAYNKGWDAVCNDRVYAQSEKISFEEGIFCLSALMKASIERSEGNIEKAAYALKYCRNNLHREFWKESIDEQTIV